MVCQGQGIPPEPVQLSLSTPLTARLSEPQVTADLRAVPVPAILPVGQVPEAEAVQVEDSMGEGAGEGGPCNISVSVASF
jgi:hypothetical protein